MTVDELRNELAQYPGDVRVDAMFPTGNDAFFVTGTELLTLRGDEKVLIVEIDVQPQLELA